MKVAFAIVAWLFVAAIVVQVFLAGVGLFVRGFDTFSYHRALGWLLHLGPLVVILLAWGAHPGRTTMWLSGLLILLVGIQPFLPAMRDDQPFVAALHPVNALAIFAVGLVIALRATTLARSATEAPAETSALIPEAPRS
jgi:uncharacterized membrane protein